MANIKLIILSAVIFASISVPILAESDEDECAKLSNENLTVEEIRDTILSLEKGYLDENWLNISTIEVMKWYSEAPFLGDCQNWEFERREIFIAPSYSTCKTYKQNMRKFLEPSYNRLILYCAENIDQVVEASITHNDREFFKTQLGIIENIRNGSGIPWEYPFAKRRLRNTCRQIREDQMRFIFHLEQLDDESIVELSEDVQAKLDAAKFVLNGNCVKSQWPLSFSRIFSEMIELKNQLNNSERYITAC